MGSNGKKLTLSLKIGARIDENAFEGFWLVNPKAKIRFEFLDAENSDLPSCFLVFDRNFCDTGVMHPVFKRITVSMNLACSDIFQFLHCVDHLEIDLPKTEIGFSRILNNDFLKHRTNLQISTPQAVCFNHRINFETLNVTGTEKSGGLCPGSIGMATNELKALVLSYGSDFPYIPEEILDLPMLEDFRIGHRINCDCSICWMRQVEARWGLHQARCNSHSAYKFVKEFLDQECKTCRNEIAVKFSSNLCAKCLRTRESTLQPPQIIWVPDLTTAPVDPELKTPSTPATTAMTAKTAKTTNTSNTATAKTIDNMALAPEENIVPLDGVVSGGLSDSQIALIVGGVVLLSVLLAVLILLLSVHKQNQSDDGPK